MSPVIPQSPSTNSPSPRPSSYGHCSSCIDSVFETHFAFLLWPSLFARNDQTRFRDGWVRNMRVRGVCGWERLAEK
ncbi:hypothetical protein M413DRAFT_449978 [Hebeloma cylindrosporum]|uniref:Uncharacterized protein n=1 Tax=Hebeloma cylindrosporum TaxID=76867 RepID=A0A0C2XAC2_HEBCY|nr:hypothetical protein M413DRAFT_449978 [Hebeloma cylindrosporum h7]